MPATHLKESLNNPYPQPSARRCVRLHRSVLQSTTSPRPYCLKYPTNSVVCLGVRCITLIWS